MAAAESENDAKGPIAMICRGLSKYYEEFAVTYYNSEGVGKFTEYCEENGFGI